MAEKSYGALEGEGGGTAAAAVPPYTGNPTGDPEAPPTYADTADGAPPPSYDSLFGQIKQAKSSSSSSTDFLKSVCMIIFSTIGFTIFIGILLLVPVSMIVVGSLKLHVCPIQPLIPIWLVVAGSVSAFMQICSIIGKSKAKCEGREDDEEESSSLLKGVNGLIGCFNVAWFFAGNVWVYKNYAPTNDQCDPVAYYLAFWIITTAYILFALVCCCSCCIAIGGRK